MKLIGLCLMMAIVMSGCASITKSTLLGIGTGAVVGGASGALIDKQNPGQTALNSALITAVIGGIAGYFTHDALEDRDANVRKDTLFNLEKFGVSGFSSGVKSKDSDESQDKNPMYNMKGNN